MSQDEVDAACQQISRISVPSTSPLTNVGIEEGACPGHGMSDWDRLIAVNFRGAFLFAKHSIPFMHPKRGAIVSIPSVHVSVPEDVACDASKKGPSD